MPEPLRTRCVRCAATFFGAGRAPVAPGTVGAAGGAVVWVLTTLTPFALATQVVLIVVLFAIGVACGTMYEHIVHRHDPSEFVLDEVCGALLTFAGLPFSWTLMACGFVLFRLFDVAKPFPISRMQRAPGGWGIMLDDLCAGGAAWGLLWIIHLHLC